MNAQIRFASITAGIALAVMAVLAPLGVMVALPSGSTGAAGLAVLAVAMLDVVVAAALYPLLSTGGALIAQIAVMLRIVYGAVFGAAGAVLIGTADAELFEAMWDAGLLIFGVHLVLVGVVLFRSLAAPKWIAALTAIAGFGYLVDAVVAALGAGAAASVAEFTFVGEVALLVWLIGWAGRPRRGEKAMA